MLMSVLNCLFDSLSQILRYVPKPAFLNSFLVNSTEMETVLVRPRASLWYWGFCPAWCSLSTISAAGDPHTLFLTTTTLPQQPLREIMSLHVETDVKFNTQIPCWWLQHYWPWCGCHGNRCSSNAVWVIETLRDYIIIQYGRLQAILSCLVWYVNVQMDKTNEAPHFVFKRQKMLEHDLPQCALHKILGNTSRCANEIWHLNLNIDMNMWDGCSI